MRRLILERCQELGLTQRQLGRLVGVHEATLSAYAGNRRWEAGPDAKRPGA